jgi:hypothetical protein
MLTEMNELCLLSNIDRLHEIGEPLVGDFVTADPARRRAVAKLLAENSAGRRRSPLPCSSRRARRHARGAERDRAVRRARAPSASTSISTSSRTPTTARSRTSRCPLIEWLDARRVPHGALAAGGP